VTIPIPANAPITAFAAVNATLILGNVRDGAGCNTTPGKRAVSRTLVTSFTRVNPPITAFAALLTR